MPVSAASIEDTAKAIDSGKKISFTPENKAYPTTYKDFKVTLSKKGTLKLSFDSKAQYIYVVLFNSNGDKVELSERSASTGSTSYSSYFKKATLNWNKTIEKLKGTLSYKSLDKGTYYVRIWTEYPWKTGKTSVSFSYPQEKEADEKAEGKISYLSVTLKKGNTLQLGAVIDGDGTVTWSTSKKAVATVTSKGKITAKAAGTATITAKLGSSSVKIKIKVTE